MSKRITLERLNEIASQEVKDSETDRINAIHLEVTGDVCAFDHETLVAYEDINWEYILSIMPALQIIEKELEEKGIVAFQLDAS